VSGTRITPAERKQADELYLASILASFDQRERYLPWRCYRLA